MIRRPPRSTLDRSSAASDVYKRQEQDKLDANVVAYVAAGVWHHWLLTEDRGFAEALWLSLIHISEPTRPY